MSDEPSAEFRKFAWNPQRIKAAELLAEDELTDKAIAAAVGISDRQLRTWKHHPEFDAEVARRASELERAMQRYAIAKRRKRVERYDRDYAATIALQESLAADPEWQHIPGWSTGLLTHTTKVIGTGNGQQTIEEFSFNVALLRERRAIMEQAAKELGQWSDKSEQKVDASDAFIAALKDFGRGRTA